MFGLKTEIGSAALQTMKVRRHRYRQYLPPSSFPVFLRPDVRFQILRQLELLDKTDLSKHKTHLNYFNQQSNQTLKSSM